MHHHARRCANVFHPQQCSLRDRPPFCDGPSIFAPMTRPRPSWRWLNPARNYPLIHNYGWKTRAFQRRPPFFSWKENHRYLSQASSVRRPLLSAASIKFFCRKICLFAPVPVTNGRSDCIGEMAALSVLRHSKSNREFIYFSVFSMMCLYWHITLAYSRSVLLKAKFVQLEKIAI